MGRFQLFVIAIFCSLLGGACSYLYSLRLPQMYGVTALLEMPTVFESKLAKQTRYDPNQGIDRAAKTFLDFKFVETKRSPSDDSPHLYKVDLQRTSELLELHARAKNFAEGKAFLEGVLKDLRTWYQPRLDDALRDNLAEIETLKKQLDAMYDQYQKNGEITRAVGYSPLISRNQTELLTQKLNLEMRLQQLESQASPQKVRNFTYILVRPSGSKPETPNVGRWTVYGFIAGLIPLLAALFFRELFFATGTLLDEPKKAPKKPGVPRRKPSQSLPPRLPPKKDGDEAAATPSKRVGGT